MQRSILAFAASAAIACAAETSFLASTPQQAPPAPPRSGAVTKPHPGTPRAGGARRGAAKRKTAAKFSPVQRTLQRDANLAGAVMLRLPAGTNLMDVSAGFTDVGQFVAAVNASRILAIPMREFKRRMAGDGMPLLLAIQDLRPKSNYRSAAKRAEEEAAAMIRPEDAALLTLATRKN